MRPAVRNPRRGRPLWRKPPAWRAASGKLPPTAAGMRPCREKSAPPPGSRQESSLDPGLRRKPPARHRAALPAVRKTGDAGNQGGNLPPGAPPSTGLRSLPSGKRAMRATGAETSRQAPGPAPAARASPFIGRRAVRPRIASVHFRRPSSNRFRCPVRRAAPYIDSRRARDTFPCSKKGRGSRGPATRKEE